MSPKKKKKATKKTSSMEMGMGHFLTALVICLKSDISQMFLLSIMYLHRNTAVISVQPRKFNKKNHPKDLCCLWPV